MRRAGLAAALSVATLAGWSAAPGAEAAPSAAPVEASPAEVRRLAVRGARDPAALARLRRIDRVDGAPVDLRAALSGPPDAAMRARLATLAAPAGGGSRADAAQARSEATEILADRRFRGLDLPQPFRRPLERLGAAVIAAGVWLADRLPGGEYTLWGIIALVVVLAALAAASRLGRRRARGRAARPVPVTGARPETARQLERRADESEARGEAALALRLRFQAGLMRLHAARRITLRPSLTTGEVAMRLRSPAFDQLAATFEAVAYGGVRPSPDELEASRSGWSGLLRERGAA